MVKSIGAVIETAASYADPRAYGLNVGTVSEMADRANKIAIPLVLATGLYCVNGAEAGPILYSACLTATTSATWGTMFWAAVAWCSPLLGPGP